jgi:hypothetical protein
MGSNYLQGVTDGFGLPPVLPAGIASLASTIVDGYLNRPEGLIHTRDASGNPCAMTAPTPTAFYKLVGSITAGVNVTVTLSPANLRADTLGEVFVLDHKNTAIVEACTVVSVIGNNQVVLGNVQFAHAAGATADVGLVITEDRSVPSKRAIVRVMKFPIVNVVSLLGRYAYGRRSDQVGGLFQDMNLLAAVQSFGGPPQWTPITVAQSSWSDSTGEIWIPAGQLMAYYSDVRIKYVAGYPVVPDPVQRATAQIAAGLIATSNLSGGLKLITAGDTRLERFANSTLDDDVKRLLDPFKARVFY